MKSDFIRYGIRFIVLVLLQVLVLNQIQFSGLINPFLYILFIITLPIKTPAWLVMVLGLVLGLSIDMFSNTGGIHAAATVLIGYIRSKILDLTNPKDIDEIPGELTVANLGLNRFLPYTAILTLTHHLVLFYIEVFRFSHFFSTLFKAVLSSVFTLLLILISQYLLRKDYKK